MLRIKGNSLSLPVAPEEPQVPQDAPAPDQTEPQDPSLDSGSCPPEVHDAIKLLKIALVALMSVAGPSPDDQGAGPDDAGAEPVPDEAPAPDLPQDA